MKQSRLVMNALLAAGLVLAAPAAAQPRAKLSAPIIKSQENQVVIRTDFSSFGSELKYRIGIGSEKGKFTQGELMLDKHGTPVNQAVTDFGQAYTSFFWAGVEKLNARGFFLEGAEVPGAEESLTLTVTIPQSEADRLAPLYVFISRDYGSNTWYIEDGVEIAESYW